MHSRLWFLASAAVSACNAPVSQDEPYNSATLANLANEARAEANEAGANSVEQQRPEWRYSSQNDPMNDRPTRTACVWSTNEVVLDFPYGNTRAELCLRDSPQYGRDAYVALEGNGQILCYSYRDCIVRVRFDDEEARTFPAVGPSDNSTNIVFIRNRDRLERGLRSAERTAIQIEFYQAGQQALIFPTAGFDWRS